GLRVAGSAVDAREVEPAEPLGRADVLAGLLREDAAHDAGVPVAHELHRDLAGREETRRGASALLRLGREVALVERLAGDELTEQPTGLDQARVVEDELGLRLLEHLGRARLEREVVPVVRRGPAVTSAHRDRSDAGRLELVDRRVELVE